MKKWPTIFITSFIVCILLPLHRSAASPKSEKCRRSLQVESSPESQPLLSESGDKKSEVPQTSPSELIELTGGDEKRPSSENQTSPGGFTNQKDGAPLSSDSDVYLIRHLAREISPGEAVYLTEEKEKELVILYRYTRDHRAFVRILAAYIVRLESVIRWMLRRWRISRNTVFIEQDLMQDAVLYFLTEIEKYDLEQKVSFGNFVFQYLPHRLNRFMYHYLSIYHIPVNIQEDKKRDSSLPRTVDIWSKVTPSVLSEIGLSMVQESLSISIAEVLPSPSLSPESVILSSEYEEWTRWLLKDLPLTEVERTVFVHRLQGKSLSEIGREIDRSVSSVYEANRRINRKVRRSLESQGFGKQDF